MFAVIEFALLPTVHLSRHLLGHLARVMKFFYKTFVDLPIFEAVNSVFGGVAEEAGRVSSTFIVVIGHGKILFFGVFIDLPQASKISASFCSKGGKVNTVNVLSRRRE